uniref:Uncharacterized protein n=1 Tax=Oryza nivara TaxID=4536 RepID=A0A0E0FGM5_ORYNI
MGMSQGRRYIKNAELLKFTLSFVVGKSRPQLSKELIGLQDKDLEFRKNMHPTREMTSNLIVLNVKYYQGSKGSCPRLDTRLNASNLGEDTTESLTKPSTTDNLLFERSRFDKYGSLQNEVVKIQTSHNEKIGALSKMSRETKLVRLPIPAGIWPVKLGGEMLRWVSSVSISNPVAGSRDALKSLPPRLRYLSDVRLKTAASRPPLCRRRPPRSREVTRPPPSPSPSQRMPAQRQQSVPARHDRNAVADAVVAENDRFSWSSAAAWSGKHGSELAIKSINWVTSPTRKLLSEDEAPGLAWPYTEIPNHRHQLDLAGTRGHLLCRPATPPNRRCAAAESGGGSAMNGSLLGCPRKSMPVVRLLRHRALLPPPPRGHQVFEGMCHRPTSQNDWNQTANMKPTVNPRPEKMNKRIMPSLSCQKLLALCDKLSPRNETSFPNDFGIGPPNELSERSIALKVLLKPRYWEFGSPKVTGSKVKVSKRGSRRLLIKYNSLRSREMTLPEAMPQVTPSQWQQSDPDRHDGKFIPMKEALSFGLIQRTTQFSSSIIRIDCCVEILDTVMRAARDQTVSSEGVKLRRGVIKLVPETDLGGGRTWYIIQFDGDTYELKT